MGKYRIFNVISVIYFYFFVCIIFDVLKKNSDCSRKSKSGKILKETEQLIHHTCMMTYMYEKQSLLGLKWNLEQNVECRLMSNSLEMKSECEDEIRL